MEKKILPLSKAYQLIEPGPVVMLTTFYKGKSNIMSMSWHMMLEFDPPLIGCVISNRNYSFELLKASKECVINIPTVELVKQVVGCGSISGKKIDKFKKFKLTPLPASFVKAPLIAECYANLECKIVDMRMVAKYNLFIFEVQKAWISKAIKKPRTIHHQGKGKFMLAGEVIKLPFNKL